MPWRILASCTDPMRTAGLILILAPLLGRAQASYPDTMGHIAMAQRVVEMGLVPPQDKPFHHRVRLLFVGPDSTRIQRCFFQDPHQVWDYPRAWLRPGEEFDITLYWRAKGGVGPFNKPLTIVLDDGTVTVLHFRGRYATPDVVACVPDAQLPYQGEVKGAAAVAHWRAKAAAIDSLLAPDSLCPNMDLIADHTFLFTAVRGMRWFQVEGPYGMTSDREAIEQYFLGDGDAHTCCGQRWLEVLLPEGHTAPAKRHKQHPLLGPGQYHTEGSADGRFVVLVERIHFSQFLSGQEIQRRIYFQRVGGW